MIIVDVETGGLDPRTHALLSIGAVDYATSEEFYIECRAQHEGELTPTALSINGFTVEQALAANKVTRADAYIAFVEWTKGREPLLAGQQVGSFDIPFLRYVSDGLGAKWPFGYRSVDLHSVAFAKLGKSLNLDGILEALGLQPEPKPHNGLTGAKLEAEAFRRLL